MLPVTLRVFILATILISTTFAADQQISYQQQVLSEHNQYRLRHHAEKLTWDNTMADYALRYASKCEFRHSATPYGENLAAGYSSISSAVSAWYDEGEKYSYYNPGFSYRTGHFTQLIWKSSKKIGCAYVSCNGRNGTPGKYLVCEYSPAGNIINPGRFAKNVLPE
jgi:uncharacterized protein YkwD